MGRTARIGLCSKGSIFLFGHEMIEDKRQTHHVHGVSNASTVSKCIASQVRTRMLDSGLNFLLVEGRSGMTAEVIAMSSDRHYDDVCGCVLDIKVSVLHYITLLVVSFGM